MAAGEPWTTKALFGPEKDLVQVETPLAAQVHANLFEGMDPSGAVLDRMRREPKGDMAGLIERTRNG